MAGREVDRLGRREGLAIGISMNLGKTVPRVAGGVSVDRIIIEHANNLGHVSSFPHQGRIADTRRLLPDGRISGALSVSAHPLPIAPLWRRVGEVDHDPRLACDPMKAFEGSIDDVYQRLEKDSSMPASIAAASSAAAMGDRGSRADITRTIASLWTGSTMSMATMSGCWPST